MTGKWKYWLAALLGLLVLAAGLAYFQQLWMPEAEPALVERSDEGEGVALPTRPAPNLPVAADAAIRFEDSPYAGVDERSSARTFTVDTPAGAKYLTATYLDEPDWQDDRNDDAALITRLMDLNAAFSAAASSDLPVAGKWESVKVHVGDFAQDYCGEVSVVYGLRSQRIFAISAVGESEVDLSLSECPLSRVTYEKQHPQRKEDEEFCTVRSTCLKRYFNHQENREKLLAPWLEKVANVELR